MVCVVSCMVWMHLESGVIWSNSFLCESFVVLQFGSIGSLNLMRSKFMMSMWLFIVDILMVICVRDIMSVNVVWGSIGIMVWDCGMVIAMAIKIAVSVNIAVM